MGRAMINTQDYRMALSGIGPLANTWHDKPHRLYDLCREIEYLQCHKAREERWAGQVEATCIARSLRP
jgi:hypothetical protein